jgi:3-methyl-2-oxobutanoate hydroxymethyltransferase
VLVCHDVLGMFPSFTPKFVKRYAELGREMERAFRAYRDDVQHGTYPDASHVYE